MSTKKRRGRPRNCERCGRKLDPDKAVALVFDHGQCRYVALTDAPPEDSSHNGGVFDFGPDCALRTLRDGWTS